MESASELAGKTLGKYRLDEKIGVGGHSIVYRGENVDIPGRPVAIKVARTTEDNERIREEAGLLARLGNHQNIVDIYDADAFAEPPFLAVQYCPNSLEKVLDKPEGVNWRQGAKWTAQLVGALVRAHEAGIVHGDIKPSNVLFDEQGDVQLGDFGAAIRDPREFAESIAHSLSIRGESESAEGTIMYWAPEQMRGEKATPQTDIHQAGQVLYEMVTGRRFIERDASGTRNNGPDWLNRVIGRATRTDPSERYATAEDMLAEIQRGLDGKLDGQSFEQKADRTLRQIAKYTGLALASPVLWPVWLYRKARDKDEYDRGSSWRTLSVIATAVYSGLIGGIATWQGVEEPAEKETRAAAVAHFEQEPGDLNLAYITDGKLRLTPARRIFDESPPFTEFALPNFGARNQDGSFAFPIVASDRETVFYGTREKMWNGESYPQINAVTPSTGHVEKLLDTRRRENSWLNERDFSEAYMGIDGEKRPYAVVRVEDQYFKIHDGWAERLDRVSFPLPHNAGDSTSIGNIEISAGNTMGVARRDSFWGVVGLSISGDRPMLIRYSPEAEK